LMFRTFSALRDVDPGVSRPEAVQIARINITAAISTDPERTTQIQRQILDGIAAIPGVEAASFGLGAPMEATRTPPAALYVEGQRYEAGDRRGRQGGRDLRRSRARALGRARGRARQARPRIAAGCTRHLARRHR